MVKSELKYKIYKIKRIEFNGGIEHVLRTGSPDEFTSVSQANQYLEDNSDLVQEDTEYVILPYVKITKTKNKQF